MCEIMRRSALVTVLLVLGSCGSDDGGPNSDASDSDGYSLEELGLDPGDDMTFDQLRLRLEDEVGAYTWPPNHRIDIAARFQNAPEQLKKDMFQSGYEFTMLSIANTCAWSIAWLDARAEGDSTGEEEALNALTNVVPNLPKMDDPSTNDYVQNMAANAALGDPTMINQYVTANCQGITWLPTPTALTREFGPASTRAASPRVVA